MWLAKVPVPWPHEPGDRQPPTLADVYWGPPETSSLRMEGQSTWYRPATDIYIGVMLCECQKKIYAAMSGDGQALAGFKKAVELLNAKDERKRWVVCDPVDFSQVRNATDVIPNGQSLFLETLPAPVNPAGACAAPKLIQKAHQDGHKPGAMTEVFYFPDPAVLRAQKRSKNVEVRTTVEVSYMETLEGVTSPVTKQFSHGEVVPSCGTCQIHLTPMLCPPAKPCPES